MDEQHYTEDQKTTMQVLQGLLLTKGVSIYPCACVLSLSCLDISLKNGLEYTHTRTHTRLEFALGESVTCGQSNHVCERGSSFLFLRPYLSSPSPPAVFVFIPSSHDRRVMFLYYGVARVSLHSNER